MKIFHIATRSDWDATLVSGEYTTSTYGRSLAEEGFIHASRREQVGPTFSRFYAKMREPLVLLTIETDRLTSRWQEDPVGDDTYPHIYGPLNREAVVRVQTLNRRGGSESFTSLFLKEMGQRIAVAILAMFAAFGGAALGRRIGGEWWPFLGALAGLAVVVLGFLVVRRVRRG